MGILGFDKQFLVNLTLVFFNIIILYFALSKILYKPIVEFLNKRVENIKSKIDDAELNLKSSKKLILEYEEKLKDIEKERAQILENAHKIALQKQNQIIEDAKQEALMCKEKAKIEISREKDKLKDSIKKQIIEISGIIASKYIKSKINIQDQEKLLDEVIKELGGDLIV